MKKESRIPVAKVVGAILAVLSVYVIVGAFALFMEPFSFQMTIPALWLPLILVAGGYRIWAAKLLFVNPTDETYAQAGRMTKLSFWINFLAIITNWALVVMMVILALFSGGAGNEDGGVYIHAEGGLGAFTTSIVIAHVLIFVMGIIMMIVMKAWKVPKTEARLTKKEKTIAVSVSVAVLVIGMVAGLIANYVVFGGAKSKNLSSFQSFTMQDIMNGGEVTEDVLKGKTTFINVWATWCSPCKGEMPALAELAEEYKDTNVQIITVCSDSIDFPSQNQPAASVEEVQSLINELGVSNLLILQPTSEAIEEIEATLSAHPTTFVVDEDGNILEVIVGGYEKDQWANKIQKYVK